MQYKGLYLLNCVWKYIFFQVIGKFSQRSDYPITKYVSNQKELEDLYHNKEFIIKDIMCVSEKICQVSVVRTTPPAKVKRNTNSVLSAFVTAYSRIELHQDIAKLIEAKCTPLYFDTDAILWAQKEGTKCPLKFGYGFGEYRNEIDGKLVSYFSLGKKKYSISYIDQNGQTQSKTKISGLCLDGHDSFEAVTPAHFASILKQYINKKKEEIVVPQIRKSVKNYCITEQKVKVCLSNNLNMQRNVDLTSKNLVTFPLGWNKHTMHK